MNLRNRVAVDSDVGLRCTQPKLRPYSTYVNSTYPNIKTSLGEFWELT